MDEGISCIEYSASFSTVYGFLRIFFRSIPPIFISRFVAKNISDYLP